MADTTRSKPCSKCKEDKPLDAFHRSKSHLQGRLTQCKDCRRGSSEPERLAKDAKHAERVRLLQDGKIRCTGCSAVKALSHFYKSTKNKSGRSERCIPCRKQEAEEYCARPEVVKTRNAQYMARRDPDPDRRRNWHLLNRYGISLDDYEKILSGQNGRCAVCGSPPAEKPLYVDHCHETGAIRGLLCQKCNSGIGLLGDTPESIQAAMNYMIGARRMRTPTKYVT